MEGAPLPLSDDAVQFHYLNQLIDKHLEDPAYTIENLCGDLGVSRSQLFRLVKDEAGISPSLHIRQRRLVKARELLESTSYRIIEISDKVGFDSSQTFAKYFTREFGLSPTDYRRQQRLISSRPIDLEKSPDLSDAENPPRDGPSVPQGWRAHRSLLLGVGGLVLLGLGVLGYFRFFGSVRASATNTFTNSVAILPFRSTKGGETAPLADGLAAQVHAALVGVENLKVISRTSAGLFRNSRKTVPQMAAELGVNYILVGTVSQAKEKIRVNVELIEAAEDRTLWAQNIEGEGQELLASMNDVARRIAQTLNQSLTDSESLRFSRLPTVNLDAFHEFQLGRQLMLSRKKNKLMASIVRFDRAIALDSSFADAYAYKASAYFILSSSDFMNVREGIRLAEQNALLAIRLDGTNGLAYATLANGYRQLNQWEQAVTTYRIALQHSPNDAQINYWHSITLRALGHFDEAIRYSTKALALDPLYPTIIVGHIGNYSYAGKYQEAEALFAEYQLTLNDFYPYYYVKGIYYLNRGNYPRALAELTKSNTLEPEQPVVQAVEQYCRARLGQRASAETYLTTLPHTPDHYSVRAVVYAGLEDRENCLRYLRLGAELGLAPDYLKVSPMFRFLHGDARFQDVLSQLGLRNPVI